MIESALERLAHRERAPGPPVARRNLARSRIARLRRRQLALYQRLEQSLSRASIASRTEEWLLDNRHVIEDAIESLADQLPDRYLGQLPGTRTGAPGTDRILRVEALVRLLIKSGQLPLDPHWLEQQVDRFQDITELSIGELWAVPGILALCSLEQLMDKVDIALASALGGERKVADSTDQAITSSVAGLIISLRTVGAHDWHGFFERVSRVDRILARDPAGAYDRMEFESRNRYRHIIEQLARGSPMSETDIARIVLRLAGQAENDDSRRSHVGYYLIGGGLDRLERDAGYHVPPRAYFRRFVNRRPVPFYFGLFGALLAAPLALLIWLMSLGDFSLATMILAGLLAILPASGLSMALLNGLMGWLVPTRPLARMDYEHGLPQTARSVVVMPVLIGDADEIDGILDRLEGHFLGNPDPHLVFAVLGDFPDAQEPEVPSDAVMIDRARERLTELQARHGSGRFLFLVRRRLYNPAEQRWMGWERKRGKLEEFNRLLGGATDTSYELCLGASEALNGVRYVITLDADTRMPPGTANRLVGTLDHPLSRAELDPEKGGLRAGYSIIQPRLDIDPEHSVDTGFSRIFSGDRTVDLYTHASSDVYHDLFGQGIFTGKGIYDWRAIEHCLGGLIPENTVLSHDLLEGLHSRVGLATDLVLLEQFPSTTATFMRRLHRWVRGDWQLLPWLGRQARLADGSRNRNRLDTIDHWKIIDNLRRSLLPPTLLILLVLAWLGWLPGSALAATGLIAAFAAAPLLSELLALLTRLLARPRLAVLTAINALPDLKRLVLHWLSSLVLLAYQSGVLIDAIARSLYRMFISRRLLLQWTTAAQAHRRVGQGGALARLAREMWISPLLAVTVTAALSLVQPSSLVVAAPFVLAWLVAPLISWRLDQAIRPRGLTLNASARTLLRSAGRRSWLFFEHFVSPDNHWLPPDNYQELPRVALARRTSPTNIGMGLNAALAAYDFGWIDLLSLLAWLQNSSERMKDLERYRGHWLNWYETENLKPLSPRYVSTVDSGNLAASLIVVAEAMDELRKRPVSLAPLLTGVGDSLAVVAETLNALAADPILVERLRPDLAWIEDQRQTLALPQGNELDCFQVLLEFRQSGLAELNQRMLTLAEDPDLGLSKETLFHLRVWLKELDQQSHRIETLVETLLPWLPGWTRLDPVALGQLRDIPAWRSLENLLLEGWAMGRAEALQGQVGEVLDRLSDQVLPPACHPILQGLSGQVEAVVGESKRVEMVLGQLRQRAQAWVDEMEFGFLYDRERQMFRIGYDVDNTRLDRNHYDLLASESRLASLVAVAWGQVPMRHWLHLGRPYRRKRGRAILMSWGATLFEYLMPELYARHPKGTLLHHANRAAVRLHRQFSRRFGLPWGISESGYYQLDEQQHYQYRSFGVPMLGFRRDLGDRLVVSPYASIMALSHDPQAVVDNLNQLRADRALGLYGFHEAVDYGRPEKLTAHRPRVVHSWMSHHQGMALLAIDNFLNDGAMVRRFHSHPRIDTVAMLLYERKPLMPPRLRASRQPRVGPPIRVAPRPETWSVHDQGRRMEATRLSNGHYSMTATSLGAGSASWNDIMLIRWQADRSSEDGGHRFLLRDLDSGQQFVFGQSPDSELEELGTAQLGPHRAEFRRKAIGLNALLRLAVSPQHDVQVHHLRVGNDTGHARRLLLVSHAEVALATSGEFDRHPAFARLFVESEYHEADHTLLFRKRPRSESERPTYLAHRFVPPQGIASRIGWDSDRGSFIGRMGSLGDASGLSQGIASMQQHSGAVLDPAIALAVEIELPPWADIELAFLTGASHSRRELLSNLAYYGSLGRIEWLFEHAAMQTAQETHLLGLDSAESRQAMSLFAATLWPEPEQRRLEGAWPDQALQLALFSLGISGDWPLIVVRVHDLHEPAELDRLIRMHTFLAGRQWQTDLVLIDESAGGYGQPSRDYLQARIDEIRGRIYRSLKGRIVLLSGLELGVQQRLALEHSASVFLEAGHQRLALRPAPDTDAELPLLVTSRRPDWAAMTLPPAPERIFVNGLGGFDRQQGAYVIETGAGESTPAPWCNVLANPDFGSLVSANGSMCTWAGNSSENRVTPWANDPVGEPSGEVIYLRDEETGEIWSLTPAPMPAEGSHRVTHGRGWTRFEHASKDLKQQLKVHVDGSRPVKYCRLELANRGIRPRRITATFYLEWVLGTNRADQAHHLDIQVDPRRSAVLARNPFSPRAGQQCAFLAADRAWHGFTTCRRDFLGQGGSRRAPVGLRRIGLSGKFGRGLDPCAAIQLHFDIPAGETRSALFLVGQGDDPEQARLLIDELASEQVADQSERASRESIEQLLGAVRIQTPEPAMDLMLNQWLPWQALAGRLWGRTGYYQSSGAFGFRDQLQDMLAMLWFDPNLVRDHLLLAASRQFIEGDVLHWWHESPLRGVRTRCSDDLLWLPYAVAQYVRFTGDKVVLEEPVAYLDGQILAAEEAERYAEFGQSERSESLYEHCKRAIDRAATVGPHGLPTIGSGDWNDGFSRVSTSGSGESVWLGWFLVRVLGDFAACCETMDEPGCAAQYRKLASDLERQIDKVAWDGAWYQRAYFDDGSPLGSASNEECRIDLIAQAWSVMGPRQPGKRARLAMAAAQEHLVDVPNRLIRLLTPPFDLGPQNPGYIKGYPPGVRENGAQYTHAATWAVWAMAQLGEGDRAMDLFRLLNPILRTSTREEAMRYRLEPYVLAGDIYSCGEHEGRGGWSWYTGAAAWLYRAGIEALLGLRREGNQLIVKPCLPQDWSGYRAELRCGQACYRLQVRQLAREMGPTIELSLDGERQPGNHFEFIDDGCEHRVEVNVAIRRTQSPIRAHDA